MIICFEYESGDLCVDDRPAVRKSSGQTLFSTIAAHGDLLQQNTWQAVIWQVQQLLLVLDKFNSIKLYDSICVRVGVIPSFGQCGKVVGAGQWREGGYMWEYIDSPFAKHGSEAVGWNSSNVELTFDNKQLVG